MCLIAWMESCNLSPESFRWGPVSKDDIGYSYWGGEPTRWPEKCDFRPVVDKKSEMKGRKNPSPRPLTPPNTLGFFLYTRITLKMLVEHQNKGFSCSVFICVNERTKCAKNPNINRVKFHHDLVLTLFVLGGGGIHPLAWKMRFSAGCRQKIWKKRPKK